MFTLPVCVCVGLFVYHILHATNVTVYKRNKCKCVLVFYIPSNMFSLLNSTQDAASPSLPRVFLNCITAAAAMSYGALWFIERFWWGYERAKDKVISPLPNRNTEFISLRSNRPPFPPLSNPTFLHLNQPLHTAHALLAEYTTLYWDRKRKKMERGKIHYTAALTRGAYRV